MGWQVPEILESQEWETKQGSNQEKSHLRLMLHWGRTLLLQGSCRCLEGKNQTSVNEEQN